MEYDSETEKELLDIHSRMEEFRTSSLQTRLEHELNCVTAENGSNTPDFILAEYLIKCLEAFNLAVNTREQWYGRNKKSNEFPYEPGSAGVFND